MKIILRISPVDFPLKNTARKNFRFIFLILFSVFIHNSFLPAQDTLNKVSNEENEALFTDEEINFLKQHPILNVSFSPSWPPFEYQSEINGYPQIQGINAALLKCAAEKAGLKLQFVPIKSTDEGLALLENSSIDILSGYTDSIEEKKKFIFTDSVYSVNYFLVSREQEIESKRPTVAVSGIADAGVDKIRRELTVEEYGFSFYGDVKEVFRALEKKKCDYALVNRFDCDSYFGAPNFYKKQLESQYTHRYALRDDAALLASILDKAFSLITPGEKGRIIYENLTSQKYYNLEHENTTVFLRKTFLYIFFLLVIAGIITVILITLVIRRKIHVIEYDELTGMPTPTKFKHDVRKVLKHAEPNEYMLISLDINDFKFVNDSFGYSQGNLILIELSNHFMQNKYKDEIVCRYNADNFIFFAKRTEFIFIEDHVFNLTDVSKKLVPYLPEKYDLTFSASVYYIDDTAQDITLMVDKANMARKFARQNFATHRVIEYTKEMNDNMEWNKEITLNMNNAFANNQFKVYYQPKYSFETEKIIGAEALIRWKDPEKGLLPPDKFVPLFERNGFIQKIDMYVFDSVCRFLEGWKKAGVDGSCPHPLTISFNLSRNHLYNPDLIKELCSIKDKYDIGPNHIEVELTESIMFDNQKRLINVMNQIKNAGYSISVDDFGSGYSSLNLLKDIPADVLKLDKEFLSNVPEDSKETTIISSVIEMSKKLNMKTVAEGVETQNQAKLLRDMGCDIAQGYYYAKPITEEEYRSLLERDFIQTNEGEKKIG